MPPMAPSPSRPALPGPMPGLAGFPQARRLTEITEPCPGPQPAHALQSTTCWMWSASTKSWPPRRAAGLTQASTMERARVRHSGAWRAAPPLNAGIPAVAGRGRSTAASVCRTVLWPCALAAAVVAASFAVCLIAHMACSSIYPLLLPIPPLQTFPWQMWSASAKSAPRTGLCDASRAPACSLHIAAQPHACTARSRHHAQPHSRAAGRVRRQRSPATAAGMIDNRSPRASRLVDL